MYVCARVNVCVCVRVPGGGMEHDEEINICSDERREGKKKKTRNFDFISKHWFQFSGALLQTMSGCNYPTPPQNGPLLWLAASNRRKALNMFNGSSFSNSEKEEYTVKPATCPKA